MKKSFFALFVGIQLLFLIAMSIYYYVIEDTGQLIHLQANPVDPQDMFYGDYADIRYEIESVPATKWMSKANPDINSKVFVLVEENAEGIYELVSASLDKIEPIDGQVLIIGNLEYYNDVEGTYELDYGIGRYFIEDNTGEKYDNMTAGMVVTVAVSSWGPKRIISIEESGV